MNSGGPDTRIYSILGELQAGVATKELDALTLMDDVVVLFGTSAADIDRNETILTRVIAHLGTLRWECGASDSQEVGHSLEESPTRVSVDALLRPAGHCP